MGSLGGLVNTTEADPLTTFAATGDPSWAPYALIHRPTMHIGTTWDLHDQRIHFPEPS